MGEYEDMIREAIREKYGSIPKMAEATGLAPTTIYHALERGIDNTRTETSTKIKDAIFGNDSYGGAILAKDERELLDVYRQVNQWERDLILNHAKMVYVHARGNDK